MATLDILIPHHNDPDGLNRSLVSIKGQTWVGDLRVVVIDDCSKPEMFSAVERLVQVSSLDVLLQRNDVNLGRPKTRNRLLELSDASHVAWLDAGDVWYPEKLERQFATLSRLLREGRDPTKIWVTCDYDWQWEGQEPHHVVQDVTGDQLKELLLGDRLRGYLWTLLSPAEAFRLPGGFDEDLPRLQDLDYFLRFVRAGGCIAKVDCAEALCRYHKSDVGRNAVEIWSCNRRIISKNRDLLNRYGKATARRIRFKIGNVSARYALHNHDFLRYLMYKLIATIEDPRYAVYRARRKLLGH
jgi:glycosyltransferase involved in cell wall biosynthesis